MPIIIHMFNLALSLLMIEVVRINVRINPEDVKLNVVKLQVGDWPGIQNRWCSVGCDRICEIYTRTMNNSRSRFDETSRWPAQISPEP